jgi:hypothetical protein
MWQNFWPHTVDFLVLHVCILVYLSVSITSDVFNLASQDIKGKETQSQCNVIET